MKPDPDGEALSRDLNGAFGDLAWALGRSAGTGGLPASPVHILIPSDESEMARQRLLLSGYELESESGAGRTLWRTSLGEEMILVESLQRWVSAAIMAASRNRDRWGTPRLTAVFDAAVRL